jgi:hypothetical protein
MLGLSILKTPSSQSADHPRDRLEDDTRAQPSALVLIPYQPIFTQSSLHLLTRNDVLGRRDPGAHHFLTLHRVAAIEFLRKAKSRSLSKTPIKRR